MKKRWILLNTMLVVIVFMTISLVLRPKPNSTSTSENSSAKPLQSQFFKNSLDKPMPGHNTDLKSFSSLKEKPASTCADFLDHLKSNPLSQTIDEVVENPLLIPENCSQPTNGYDLQEILNACKIQVAENIAPPTGRNEACGTAILKLKSQLMLEGARLDDMNSMTFDQLVARLFNLMTTQPFNNVEFNHTLHELNNRDPNNASLKKGLALTYALDSTDESKSAEEKNQAKENFDRYAKEASQLNPEDWQVFELRFYVLAQTNIEEAKALAERLRTQYPNSGVGPYYLGWYAWKNQARTQALNYVHEARNREPHVERFINTYNALESAEFGTPVFQIQVGFAPSDL